jgi:4-hydroxyphenylpyruvate dioxygenase
LEILDAEGDIVMIENPLEMRGLAFIEFASPRPDDLDKLFTGLGFSRTHRHRSRALDGYRQGKAWFLVDQERASFAQRFMAEHGPCVSALGFAFEDPRAAYDAALKRGAVPFDGRGGTSFDAPAIYGIGESLVYFVDAKSNFERELERVPAPRIVKDKGFLGIDHLTNNVPQGELGKWSDFYKKVFGFVEVRHFDIEGTKSGLYSYALRAPCGTFSIPINEDKGNRGQIAEYLREYRGSGVQHIALLTRDVLSSVEAVGQAVDMLDIEDDYYEEAFKRVPSVREDRARIQKNRVLLDGDPEGYLLQIFTKNVIGPIFFELIQRENHLSFGEGNFSALFRSIERDQERRGVL